ncbi:hypothetical protein SHELI_v1c09820 [Spiroplasma helicoides]|uniref:Uncharacterized protein n=1 Tax=Spiroplasma helicoides TaxID=216938 RepID=A0A1B3SLW6_9MOLU|nr:hypothetical protein [Spiroplasma helicoides]AOG60929.1 hypothetical protein SHELI_v1c09820 [Spiroplasma helicoides]
MNFLDTWKEIFFSEEFLGPQFYKASLTRTTNIDLIEPGDEYFVKSWEAIIRDINDRVDWEVIESTEDLINFLYTNKNSVNQIVGLIHKQAANKITKHIDNVIKWLKEKY